LTYVIKVARRAGVAVLFVAAAMFGALSGVLFAYADDLPQISALDDYSPSTITRVRAADGQVIGEFATQRRLVIGYDDISPHFRQAIIAAEDGGFDRHFGISMSSIAIRLSQEIVRRVHDRMVGRRSRPAGASTITQQLARNLFPEAVGFEIGDVSLERKIREAIVAIQIEKRYTKREILTFYANHVLFGHGTYGVEAASRMYFAKAAKDLTLDEAALLAGIVQLPARQSPFVNVEAAKSRRNYTLQRMADEGFIAQTDADAAKELPVVVHGQPQPERSIAPYFLEEVRQHLEARYGARQLYEGGLAVTTTLDLSLQQAANQAVDRGLRRIDKRRGYRRPTRNVIADGQTVESYKHERWARSISAGDIVPAVVEAIGKPAPPGGARLRIGRYRADLNRDAFAWTRRTSAEGLFRVGDLVEVEIRKIDAAANVADIVLEQVPIVEGALIAIDNRTGHVKAMVGGFDFNRSKFNRAVQAFRQLGSTFKPVVYTAAIDRGFTPASVIVDEPVTYPAANDEIYSPSNYDHEFEGPITLRRALEQSRNIPAIRMMETLGPNSVLAYARRFGFSQSFPPYLSVALGAGDGTLVEVTSAYTVFPNQGVRMKPVEVLKVVDRSGNLLEENRAEPVDVIRADTAFVVTSLLSGVVRRGTGQAAAALEWPLAGKTGTVDDNTDAWFVGFDPDITVGVWVGLDEKKPIGPNETGAVAALPIWIEFMRAHIASHPDKEDPPQFEPPGNIIQLAVNPATGGVAGPNAAGAIFETFIAGTQPGGLSRDQ
jgi:penicillin-binding protein 1A